MAGTSSARAAPSGSRFRTGRSIIGTWPEIGPNRAPAVRSQQLNFPARCSKKHPSNIVAGSDKKMKLVRYGAIGQERPGLIDKSGQLRDLSAYVKDLDGEAYSPASLAKLAAIDPASLPAVNGKPRLGAPVT